MATAPPTSGCSFGQGGDDHRDDAAIEYALVYMMVHASRSPLSFFMHYYRQGIGAAWHLGLRHGTFCLGCCWALMLVMFGVGVGSIVWMAVLTGLMLVEKTYPGGQRLSPWLGIALLLLMVFRNRAGPWFRPQGKDR